MRNTALQEGLFFFVASIFIGILSSLLGPGSVIACLTLGYWSRRIMFFRTHLVSAFGLLLGMIPLTTALYFHFEGSDRIIYQLLLLLVGPLCFLAGGKWCSVRGKNLEAFVSDPEGHSLRRS